MTRSIKIGEAVYTVSPPAEDALEQALRLSLGVGIAEMRDLLDGDPLCSTIARALLPFIADAPPMPVLAAAIDVAGAPPILNHVRRLYAAPKPAKVKPDAGE